MSPLGCYVAGAWRPGGPNHLNPSTGESLGELAVASPQDVADAVAAAGEAFGRWRTVTAPDRAALLTRAVWRIRARAGEFGRVIATELGNILPAATFEAMVAADVMDGLAGEEHGSMAA